MNNPFRYGRIVSDDAFCPRPEPLRRIAGFVRSAQNASIQGERRMGKTSLALAAARSVKGCRVLYADLLGIRSAEDFCKRIAAAAGRLEKGDSFLRRTLRLLSRLRPSVKLDPATGDPVVAVDVRALDPADSVDAVFDMIAGHARTMKLCVVLDEFQDVLDAADADALVAQMRGRIQFLTDVCFLFLGSVRNRMYDLFASPSGPFFKSALLFEVGAIPDAEFVPFLREKFASGRRRADDAFLGSVLDCACRTSGDVQQLCHALWDVSEPGDSLDGAAIRRALETIYAQEGAFYARQLRLLTAFQEKVLVAVAAAGGVETLTSAFMDAAGSSNRSSVKKALSRLVELEILFLHDGRHRFVNPFFRLWLLSREGAFDLAPGIGT